MDPTLSPDLVAALVTIGGLVTAGSLAVLAARRARAARQRQIDAADQPRPPLKAATRTLEIEDEAHGAAAGPAPRPEEGAGTETAEETRESQESRPDARILPFERPAPVAPEAPPPAPPVTKPEVVPGQALALGSGLAKTRAGWVSRLGQIFSGKREIDPSLVEEMEKVLLTADIGVRTSQKLLEDIRSSMSRKELTDVEAVWGFLRQRCREILSLPTKPLDLAQKPFVLLVIGVNGSGKTTTIGKLAAQIHARGKTVLLAAGDTFRAAAVEQLEVWGQRVSAPVARGKEGADPSSVIFEGIKRAKSEGIDAVIADTAGRLHTKSDLMQELQKVRRVIAKADASAPHETWLVIDATSGQNAIAQAKIFTEVMAVTGIVLTKLDGTAKGGVILGIVDQLGIPVRYIGIGERVEDLRAFDAEEFVDALFERPRPASAA